MALILLVQLAQLFLASSLPLSLLSGLVFVLIFNGELATSNMMFLTSGAYYGKIKWSKVCTILLYCTFFNFVGALILAWFFNQSFSFHHLTDKSFLVTAVSTKLGKTDWMNFTEGITANMFVNLAILGYMLLKEESAKIFIALSAIFMFVFLVNEHLIANFASFMLLGFNGVMLWTISHWQIFYVSG